MFEFKHGEPKSDYLTILRVLEITDEYIKRALINNNKIEQILLIEDRKEAQEAVRGGYPRNVVACYTADGYQVGTRTGGPGIFAVNKYRGPPRFYRNLDLVLRQYEELLFNRGEIIKSKREELRKMEQEELPRRKQLLVKVKEELYELDRQHYDLESERVRLVKELEEGESTNSTTVMEEAKQDAIRQMQLIKKQFADLAPQKAQAMEQEKALKVELEGLIDRLNRLEERIQRTKVTPLLFSSPREGS